MSPSKKYDHGLTAPREIHPATRSVVDTQFTDVTADRFDVARIASSQSINSHSNFCFRLLIFKTSQLFIEEFRAANLDHRYR